MAKFQEECDRLRLKLLECIRHSRCYLEENKSPRECINRGIMMPEECKEAHIDLMYCRKPEEKKKRKSLFGVRAPVEDR
ncbi:uncharacterized protein LOC128227507 [Mya arenaria]|uniref:uncharacterized protein LOC128227507 n=1 Tax=Mya arenaria TaxID=6604 RepID=UPI0022E8385A|nr:uncharacterized protein LOC128227507 [Mya arenaria]